MKFSERLIYGILFFVCVFYGIFLIFRKIILSVLKVQFKDFKVVLVEKQGRTINTVTLLLALNDLVVDKFYNFVIMLMSSVFEETFKKLTVTQVLFLDVVNSVFEIFIIGVVFYYFLLNYKKSFLKIVSLEQKDTLTEE